MRPHDTGPSSLTSTYLTFTAILSQFHVFLLHGQNLSQSKDRKETLGQLCDHGSREAKEENKAHVDHYVHNKLYYIFTRIESTRFVFNEENKLPVSYLCCDCAHGVKNTVKYTVQWRLPSDKDIMLYTLQEEKARQLSPSNIHQIKLTLTKSIQSSDSGSTDTWPNYSHNLHHDGRKRRDRGPATGTDRQTGQR